MKKTLVAVADLGRFKAFRLVKGKQDSRAHLELLKKNHHEEILTKLSEQLADNAGRFPGGAGGKAVSGEMGSGERHNIVLEHERRAIHAMAHELNNMLEGDEYEICWLAAAQAIQPALLDALHAGVRRKVEKALPLNLTKSDAKDVLKHFEAGT
jgi:hypothetical protein